MWGVEPGKPPLYMPKGIAYEMMKLRCLWILTEWSEATEEGVAEDLEDNQTRRPPSSGGNIECSIWGRAKTNDERIPASHPHSKAGLCFKTPSVN